MQRTKLLRLQKPEPGDEYSSDTITKNYRTIDRVMANIGGNIARRDIAIAKVFKTNSSDITLDGGGYTIYGNGMAYIEVNFTNKKSLSVNKLGMVDHTIIGELFPEFAPAITQPLTSGGIGMAVTGYIYTDPGRIALRMLKGKVTNSIAAGTSMQLSGYYHLAEVPTNIGLEYMNPRSFDYEIHNRNLARIDSVAKKVKTKLPFTQLDPKFVKIASGFKFAGDPHITRNTNGMVAVTLTVQTLNTIASTNGDIANTTIATITDSNWWPNRYVKMVSTAAGRVFQGEIRPQNGEILIGSFAGNGTINKNESINLTGNWVYDGD